MIVVLGTWILIQVCQQQFSQPLARLFPIPEHLRNYLLFRIPYLIVRMLMIILCFDDVPELINTSTVILSQFWNNFWCNKIRIHHSRCLTYPSNEQLVKDEGAQIFYSIQLQTKLIGIGANCENPSQSLPHNKAPMTRTYGQALIPLIGPCALPIHPMTNWWRMKGHKSFLTFDHRPSALVLERIVKIPYKFSLHECPNVPLTWLINECCTQFSFGQSPDCKISIILYCV